MKKSFIAFLAAAALCSCGRESFDSKVLSVETAGSGEYTLVTSEVYPGQGDTIKVWIALPAGEWDGRLVGTGGSGYYGGKPDKAIAQAKLGRVGVACNCGHDVKDWSFMYDERTGGLNAVQARDFGYYGLHVMTVYAKEYVREHYGRDPHHCYFTGASTGGRHALQVAQKYPDDYDAVFCGCPAWHNDIYVPARAWAQVVMKEENHFMPMSKFTAAREALIAYEDGDDGLVDGIVSNPFDIDFDLGSIVGTVVDGDVFTEDDARVIRRIWDGCPYEGGKLWYFFTPTSDFGKVARCDGEPLHGHLEGTTLGMLRYCVEFDRQFCLDSLDMERYLSDVFNSNAILGDYMSASPDLRKFASKGKKMLIMHGLDDNMVPPGGTLRYFEDVSKVMGGYEKLSPFMRLYLVPGVNHSFNGPGANLRCNNVDILIDWVENGNEPDELIFEKEGFGRRPFYPYPYSTEYLGGPVDDQSSFGCSKALHQSFLDEVNSVNFENFD